MPFNEKVNLELDLLGSDYTYRENKGEVGKKTVLLKI